MAARPSYSELLRKPQWQKRRLEILARDGWACCWCGDRESNLQVDHRHYVRGRLPWEYPDADLTTLCEACHGRITELRREGAELLGQFDVRTLPLVLDQVRAMLPGPTRAILEAVPAPRKLALRDPVIDGLEGTGAIVSRLDLDSAEREKRLLFAGPLTDAASLRIDDIDSRINEFWDWVGDQVDARYSGVQ